MTNLWRSSEVQQSWDKTGSIFKETVGKLRGEFHKKKRSNPETKYRIFPENLSNTLEKKKDITLCRLFLWDGETVLIVQKSSALLKTELTLNGVCPLCLLCPCFSCRYAASVATVSCMMCSACLASMRSLPDMLATQLRMPKQCLCGSQCFGASLGKLSWGCLSWWSASDAECRLQL